MGRSSGPRVVVASSSPRTGSAHGPPWGQVRRAGDKLTFPLGPPNELEDNNTMTVSFDTLTAARKLEAAGIERQQAEAIAETMYESNAANLSHLATKADLEALRADMLKVAIGIVLANVTLTAGFTFAIVRLFLA